MDTKRLRQKILDLAIRGKLVPQDPNDEPASVLLERISAEKERLIKEGKIKRSKKSASDTPHYENVPFEIPDSWEWVTLGEICSFLSRGKSPKYSEERKYPVFAQKCNLYDGDISLEKARFLDPNTLSRWSDEYKLRDGDVLINSTGTGTVGRTRLFHSDVLGVYPFVVPDSHVSVVRTLDEIDSKFVLAFLSSDYGQTYMEDNLAGSTNQKELYIGIVENMQFPLPPKEEQNRISSEIEKWATQINVLDVDKGELQGTIDFVKSKILNLAIHGKLVPQDSNDEPALDLLKRINPSFVPCDNAHDTNQLPKSWCWATLGNIFQHNTGKALNKSDSLEGTLKPYLTTSNVYWDSFDFTEVKQMYFKDSEIDKCTVQKGDLLVCEGGDIGRAAIWNYDHDICIQNHIHRLRAKGMIDHRLYLYVLMLYKWRDKIHGKGIGLQGLSSGLLDKLIIPVSPYNEQKRIVAKIEELFAVLDEIKESLEA